MSDRIRADVFLSAGDAEPVRVGAVADDGRSIRFAYALDYAGPSISPIFLPRQPAPARAFVFPELRGISAFQGLPGVLADSLPDRFGTRLMNAYFQQTGVRVDDLSPVRRLLYIGDRAMGALTFAPADGLPAKALEENVTLALLRDQARRAIQGQLDQALSEIRMAASSAGGMRAKALINWDRETNEVGFGSAPASAGHEPWLVKFDGVGEDADPQPWCRLEYAYTQMAAEAGIEIADVTLIADGELRHFAAKRFDREGAHRIHVASLAGLQHVDFNVPGACGYELACQTCLELSLGAPEIEEMYRRMLFNVIACNQDDHPKQIEFLMDPSSGLWRLAPAYDLTYAHGAGYTRTHQMSVRGRVEGITRDDLLAVGRQFGVRRPEQQIDHVAQAVARWPAFAREVDLPTHWVDACQKDHRLKLAITPTVTL